MELEMIANRLQNAHAYPCLLPHLAAEGIIPYSWSPPASRLLSLRAGAGPSDPPPAPQPSPPSPSTRPLTSSSSSHQSNSRPRPSPRRPQTPHPSQPLWPAFHGACNNCGEWGHKQRHCNAPARGSRVGPGPRFPPVPRPTPPHRPHVHIASPRAHRLPEVYQGNTVRHAPHWFEYCVRTHRSHVACDYQCHFCPGCMVDLCTTPHRHTCSFANDDELDFDPDTYLNGDF